MNTTHTPQLETYKTIKTSRNTTKFVVFKKEGLADICKILNKLKRQDEIYGEMEICPKKDIFSSDFINIFISNEYSQLIKARDTERGSYSWQTKKIVELYGSYNYRESFTTSFYVGKEYTKKQMQERLMKAYTFFLNKKQTEIANDWRLYINKHLAEHITRQIDWSKKQFSNCIILTDKTKVEDITESQWKLMQTEPTYFVDTLIFTKQNYVSLNSFDNNFNIKSDNNTVAGLGSLQSRIYVPDFGYYNKSKSFKDLSNKDKVDILRGRWVSTINHEYELDFDVIKSSLSLSSVTRNVSDVNGYVLENVKFKITGVEVHNANNSRWSHRSGFALSFDMKDLVNCDESKFENLMTELKNVRGMNQIIPNIANGFVGHKTDLQESVSEIEDRWSDRYLRN